MFLFLVAPTAPLWNLCSSTPSPRFTTCCCTRKELRWPFVWQMDCREWFPCWRRVTPSSWPSPQTVCSCCHTATRRARCVWIYYFSLHLFCVLLPRAYVTQWLQSETVDSAVRVCACVLLWVWHENRGVQVLAGCGCLFAWCNELTGARKVMA